LTCASKAGICKIVPHNYSPRAAGYTDDSFGIKLDTIYTQKLTEQKTKGAYVAMPANDEEAEMPAMTVQVCKLKVSQNC
jgi:hypothetical protein